VKVRRVYERVAGAQLDEICTVNGHSALEDSVASGVAAVPRGDAFLVHPAAAKLEIRGAFSHLEMRTVQESYTTQVPYTASESYSCGTGTSFRTCTRSVTRYRSETRYRTVTKNVPIGDGECSRAVFLQPAVGQVYLIDFTYQDSGVCSAMCIEQTTLGPDGSFGTRPCPTPTAEQLEAISAERPRASRSGESTDDP
jgi:hypothetical protein